MGFRDAICNRLPRMRSLANARRLRLRVAACGFGLLAGVVAQAADAPSAALEEVVVTATKTGETALQTTPITISALTSEEMAGSNMVDMKEIALRVPNANFANTNGFSQAFIRGVGNTSTGAAIGGETNVGFYVDGVYLERGVGANTEFFDVERIEVLRGPQGVLYGRNSTGGAVNIVTKDPGEALNVSAGVTLGNYDRRRIDLSIGGPIVPGKLSARISGSLNRRNGYIDNLIGTDQNDEHSSGLRGKLKYTPSDAVTIVLAGDWYRQRAVGDVARLVYAEGATWPMLQAPIPSDFWTANIDLPGKSDDADGYGGSATFDVNFRNGIALRSITAYRKWDRDFQIDADNNEVRRFHLLLHDRFNTFTEELQLRQRQSRWEWQLGLFYYKLHNLWGGDFQMDAIIPGLLRSPELDLHSKAWAAYANVALDVTERVTLNLGARYSDEDKDATTTTNLSIGSFVRPTSVVRTQAAWSDVSPRVSLDYRIKKNAMLYASVSKGFRAGQIADSNPPPYPTQVDPESLWSYEIGAKTTWADGRVRANAAVFFYDYKNMQQDMDVDGVGVITNADSGKLTGAELELLARPLSSLTLSAMLSYLDTEYGSFNYQDADTGEVMNVKGKRFRYAPKYKSTLGADYAIALPNGGRLNLRSDITFVSDIYFWTTNNPKMAQGSYSVLNAAIGYTRDGSPWSVLAYGKNLTATEYYRDKFAVGFIPAAFQGFVGDPRNYGVQVVYRY